MPGDAEPAVSLALSPPEEQLLALIREGRFDAEIAVRLGVTNRDVKERIERLVAKLGVRDRAELRLDVASEIDETASTLEPAPARQPEASPRAWLAGAGLIGLAIGVALTWLAMRDTSEPPTLRDLPSRLTPASGEVFLAGPTFTDSPAATPTPRSTIIAGRMMLDAGQLFTVRGSPNGVAAADARADLVAVTLADVGVFRFAAGPVGWHVRGSGPQNLVLRGELSGGTVTLGLQTAGATRFLHGDPDSAGIYTTDGTRPQVVAWVSVPENPSIRFHVEVGADGHLYVSTEMEDAHLPFAWDTGEALDVAGALQFSSGAWPGDHWTFCSRQSFAACQALVRGLQTSPVAGQLTCSPNRPNELADAELRGAQFSLHLIRTGRVPPCDFTSRTVAAGDPLPFGGDVLVSAFAPDGSPLSVAVSRDGTLYIGTFKAAFGCPCRSGS